MPDTRTRSAIVTGAGSGIGAAVARRLAAAGWEILLVGRRRGPLAAVARDCDGRGHVHIADVAQFAEPARIAGAALDRWGRVDGLVNNAGTAEMVPLADTDAPLLERMFHVNTFAPILLAAALWPTFVRQGGADVVTVTSMAAVDPFPGLAAYAAAKAAAGSLARTIRNEGAEHGIRAWSVAPGAVETAMLRALISIEQLPPEQALDADSIAAVVADCLEGRRTEPSGSTILLPSPDAA